MYKTRRYLTNFNTAAMTKRYFDVIIIGSGIAGLTAAIKTSRVHNTALLTKSTLKETSTWYAQGGIATAFSEQDSPRLHLQDTLEAGAGLCNREAVQVLVTEGPDRIAELVAMGTDFDKVSGIVRLTREGGHSLPRILHAGDATGSVIEETLLCHITDDENNLTVMTDVFAVDILSWRDRCVGVLLFNEASQEYEAFFAKATILATGGIGQLYQMTTNPVIATGDGAAMAFRAGAVLADMEFLQFHPTALDDQQSPRSLITEALRGEGAYLRDCTGARFMKGKHPLAELAPRDVVVRGMVEAMEKCNEDHVYLDATHIPREQLKARFPHIFERCLDAGFDLSLDLTPVSPVAHYAVGGVKATVGGRTNIDGLYVSGEIAATGIHGANRLASNSLLEGLVMSTHIAQELPEDIASFDIDLGEILIESSGLDECVGVDIEKSRCELQSLMTDKVGIIKNEQGLLEARQVLDGLWADIDCSLDCVKGFELQNMVMLSRLICQAALLRTESRGVHYRSDYPDQSDDWLKHILLRRDKDEVKITYAGLSG